MRTGHEGALCLLAMDESDARAGDPVDLPIDLPLDGTLDLHAFAPRDVKDVVVEYIRACQARGVLHLRIVHGKGTGALRRQVHGVLGRLPEVASFGLANESGGSWGATLVTLQGRDVDE
jgi:DNA-nicking Smr family endonuclease